MRRILAPLVLAAVMAGQTAQSATINGIEYDISLITGTAAANQTLLESQVFYNDGALAVLFADEVSNTMGTPNTLVGQPIGPLAVEGINFGFVSGRAFSGGLFGNQVQSRAWSVTENLTFITATVAAPAPVPLPASLALLLSALGGLSLASWRKQRRAAAYPALNVTPT